MAEDVHEREDRQRVDHEDGHHVGDPADPSPGLHPVRPRSERRRAEDDDGEHQQRDQAAELADEVALALEQGDAEHGVHRVLPGLGRAEARPDGQDDTDDQREPAPVERADVLLQLVADHRELREGGVDDPVLQLRVALQDEPEDGHERQEQREQREEAVVGDQGAVVAARSSPNFLSTAMVQPAGENRCWAPSIAVDGAVDERCRRRWGSASSSDSPFGSIVVPNVKVVAPMSKRTQKRKANARRKKANHGRKPNAGRNS